MVRLHDGKERICKGMAVNKMNKSQFLAYVSECSGIDKKELAKSYSAIVEGIADLTAQGYELSFTGFGVFQMKTHKGHPVQFGSDRKLVKDYVVLKFSASDALNANLRKLHKRCSDSGTG